MSANGFKADDFHSQISDAYGSQQEGYTAVCVRVHMRAYMHVHRDCQGKNSDGSRSPKCCQRKGAESNPHAQSSWALTWN